MGLLTDNSVKCKSQTLHPISSLESFVSLRKHIPAEEEPVAVSEVQALKRRKRTKKALGHFLCGGQTLRTMVLAYIRGNPTFRHRILLGKGAWQLCRGPGVEVMWSLGFRFWD